MTINLTAAGNFLTSHARLLDRRRFEYLFRGGAPEQVAVAVDAYRNPDGGYGWGLEPDLRAVESQPAGALHALEVFEELGPHAAPRAADLCDWLAAAALPDGGLPFALPVADPTACAPFWADADATRSSLHITAAVAAQAHRVARDDPAVASHPWRRAATDACLDPTSRLHAPPHAIELMFVLHLLDALPDLSQAEAELSRVLGFLPDDATMHVAGGLEDESLRPLDFSPFPDGAVRAHIGTPLIAADLDRLAALQQDDGGWVVDFTSYSAMAELEWRGYATVHALAVLRSNGHVPVDRAAAP